MIFAVKDISKTTCQKKNGGQNHFGQINGILNQLKQRQRL